MLLWGQPLAFGCFMPSSFPGFFCCLAPFITSQCRDIFFVPVSCIVKGFFWRVLELWLSYVFLSIVFHPLQANNVDPTQSVSSSFSLSADDSRSSDGEQLGWTAGIGAFVSRTE